jgi:hypothetical protein
MRTISRTICVLICVYLAAGDFVLAMESAKESVASEFSPLRSVYKVASLEPTFEDSMLQTEPVDAAKVVVIPTVESVGQDPDLIEVTTRDLNIMCRIFDKELGLSGRAGLLKVPLLGDAQFFDTMLLNTHASHQGQQFPTFFGEKARGTRSIYLGGYGAVLFVKVGFPLTPPPQVEDPNKETEADVDPVWRLAEQELYEPSKLKERQAVSAAGRYHEGKVEDLKRRLLRTLKHSANIRSLKPSEQIIVTVRGPQLALGRAKVLSIRAKKSDIDAFAKGEVDFDQFRKKVQMLMY